MSAENKVSSSELAFLYKKLTFLIFFPVLRIGDVYPGFRIQFFSIPDPRSRVLKIPDPGSASKNLSILTQKISVPDLDPNPDPDSPDPHVFGPPGSGSTSQRYGSGSGSGSRSGSFYHLAKIVRKPLIVTIL
jgi:hypothetical protein